MYIGRIFSAAAAIAFVLSVTACAPPLKMMWVRTDGQRISTNPALVQQAQIDMTICNGERQRADLSGVTVSNGGFAAAIAAQQRSQSADEVAKGCMAQKGYLFVPEDKAEETRASLAATASQRGVAAPDQAMAAKMK